MSMQLKPTLSDNPTQQERIQEYLKTYFDQAKFDVYWGSVEECIYDLWKAYKGG